jgi:hypothetical protein
MHLQSSIKVKYKFNPTTYIVTGPHCKLSRIVSDVKKNLQINQQHVVYQWPIPALKE